MVSNKLLKYVWFKAVVSFSPSTLPTTIIFSCSNAINLTTVNTEITQLYAGKNMTNTQLYSLC